VHEFTRDAILFKNARFLSVKKHSFFRKKRGKLSIFLFVENSFYERIIVEINALLEDRVNKSVKGGVSMES
jgi:hypothetical protein